ncbi:MAG: tRNA dihydrouridine synthase DusB [Alphaproteobacteria bacterium]|nr:tRNA dihydrouridine synthase DusB [Alphaproteobacteria bacterium]
MSISIGPIITRNNVFLAPMSGVTDQPFRAIAHEAGAGLVVSEMVASEELVRERADMLRRTLGKKDSSPFVIQLAGREAHWMTEGTRIAQDLGADIIDINMGCPSRQVTGGLSGSALMRNLDHAMTLVEATVNAAKVPVTLKMRLGWDDNSHNAPELAKRAQNAGVALITVHGRTRCQFYTGRADWRAIRAVREVITIPLIANGDGQTPADAKEMMRLSGADGVMIGRGSYGRPWWPGVVAEAMKPGSGCAEPDLPTEKQYLMAQQHDTLSLYGHHHGNKAFRKHLGWAFARLEQRKYLLNHAANGLRQSLLREVDNAKVTQGIEEMFAQCLYEVA